MRKQRAMRNVMGWIAVAAMVLVTGAFCMPGTSAQEATPHVEVYGFVQADYIQDFKRVDNAWKDTLRPSKIPTTEGQFGEDGQASMSAKQSRLGVLMNFPTSNGAVYTKFEFDMFGVGGDEGQTTIRLRHAYGQWKQLLAGQTNTLFMDASIFPNVVDYWGPAGMVFIRNPQIRWTPMSGKNSFAVAIERPSSDIDPGQIREFDPGLASNLQGSTKVPDLTAQFRMERDWGHFQVAGVVRKVAFDTAGTPDNEPKGSEMGWGIDVTSGIKLGQKNKLLVGVVHGEGIASYMNDGGNDLGPDGAPPTTQAELIPLTGISAYLDHTWSEKFSTSFGYSETSVDNTSFQSDESFKAGRYASANLIYYPTQNVFIAGEALWGQREDHDGDTGDDTRMQFSFHYSFSTKDIFKKN